MGARAVGDGAIAATVPDAAPRTIALRDGRRLAWIETGDPRGRPLLYFHGVASSRLESALVAGPAARRGVRLIAVDRPGHGLSDFQPGRTVLDWPRDVERLMDALGLERASLAGASGGAAYALACARAIPSRLEQVGVICGMGPIDDPRPLRRMMPFNRLGLKLLRRAPWFAMLLLAPATPLLRHRPQWIVSRLARQTSAADRAFFARPEHLRAFAATLREAFRHGPAGTAHDLRLMARPWGFGLGEVEAHVRLWHGEDDRVVPVEIGRHVAASLPRVSATFYPGEGHFSLAIDRAAEMLGLLAATA